MGGSGNKKEIDMDAIENMGFAPHKDEWEERFIIMFEEFSDNNLCCEADYCDKNCAEIKALKLKSFIAQEIQKAKEEERKRIVKLVEGMRKSEDKYSKRDNSQILWTDIGYNQALTDLTNNLTEK